MFSFCLSSEDKLPCLSSVSASTTQEGGRGRSACGADAACPHLSQIRKKSPSGRPISALIRLHHPSRSLSLPLSLSLTPQSTCSRTVSLALFLPSSPLTGRWYRAQCAPHRNRRRRSPTRCGTSELSTMPGYARLALVLLCLVALGECRRHRSRKKRWSAPADTHKPGRWVPIKQAFY